jgi:phosphoglycerol transferase MdoB-like AlkP superfamily enzyme
VVYGDHEGLERTDLDQLDGFKAMKSDIERSLAGSRVPLIMIGAGLRPGVDSTPSGQVDVAPTVGGLLGLPTSGFIGRDLGSESQMAYVNVRDRFLVGKDVALFSPQSCFGRDGRPARPADCGTLSALAAQDEKASSLMTRLNLGQRLIEALRRSRPALAPSSPDANSSGI